MLFKECKYAVKEKRFPSILLTNIEISSHRENSDEENSGKETFAEYTSNKENSCEKKGFFLYIKMVNKYYKTKKQRKASKRSTREVPKSF